MNKSTLLAIALITVGSSVQLYGEESPAFQEKQIIRTPAGPGPLSVRMLVPSGTGGHGALRTASESDTFLDGDRFRLAVSPREGGYIYVVCLTARGNIQLLYPYQEDGDNFVERKQALSLPANGWFRFDEDPGMEHVYVIESPERLRDLEEAVNDQGEVPAALLRKYLKQAAASKGIERGGTQGDGGQQGWREARIVVKRLDLDHVSR
jgi:hypothetical protein